MSDCRHNAPNCESEAGDVQTQWQQLDEQTREKRLDELIDRLYNFEGEPDLDEIDRGLEELEAAGVEFEEFDVEQGLKDFYARYGDTLVNGPKEVKKTARRRRPLARIAIIAAALCAFVFTAQASGLDILGAIARWTSEQFSFVKVGEEKDEREDKTFESLQDALDKAGVEEQLAPTEFPDGAELVDILTREEEGGLLLSATYALSEEKFYVSIRKAAGVPHGEIEIDNPNVEVYEVGKVKHHLMSDVKQRKVTWYNGDWECYIAGDLSRNDLLMMIDSIYE